MKKQMSSIYESILFNTGTIRKYCIAQWNHVNVSVALLTTPSVPRYLN